MARLTPKQAAKTSSVRSRSRGWRWREQVALDVRAGINPDFCLAGLRRYQVRLAALRSKRPS